MWMVPNAAAREAKSACTGLVSQPPLNPALCPGGGHCKYPIAAPDFTAYDHNGKPVKLSDFRGKVVLLNFWASWCGVCETEKPHLEQDGRGARRAKDFVVIALASDHNWTDVLIAIVEALVAADQATRWRSRRCRQALDASTRRRCPTACRSTCCSIRRTATTTSARSPRQWGIKAVPESALIDRRATSARTSSTSATGSLRSRETCLRSVIDE